MENKLLKFNDLKNDIAKTLFLPLAMKSKDYQQKNSILHDKYSFDIANKISDINTIPTPKGSFIGTNLRSKYIDEQCIKYAKKLYSPIFVILGCGLDTRFFRIREKINAEFFELDLPEVIKIKQLIFPENPSLISASMFDTNWMDKLKNEYPDNEFIFVIEGVLMYFNEKEIKELFINLEERFKGILIADINNKWMANNQKKHDLLKNNKAKLTGGFDNLHDLEINSIKLVEEISIFALDSKRYGFIGFLSKFFKNIRNALRIATFSINKSL